MKGRLIRRPVGLVGILAAAILAAALVSVSGTRLTWRVEIVDGSGDAGRHSSLAIAPNGTLYVLYQDDGGGTLRLATSAGSGWSSEQVTGPGLYTGDTNIAVDTSGALHILYYDQNRDTVRYGVRGPSPGAWNISDVDTGHVDEFSGLVLDRLGTPHVVYTTYSNTLRYAHFTGSSWIREDVDASGPGAAYESIALDRNGIPHVAYFGFGHLRYASRPGSTWIVEDVGGMERASWYVRFGLDRGGTPHIVYYDAKSASLGYARRSPDAWLFSTIDAAGNPGLGTSLVVGPDDRLRVAYYAQLQGVLRYAESVNGTWEIQTVDDDSTVGWEPSLALDPGGAPHVTYYDWTRGALRHAVGLSVLGTRTLGASEVTTSSARLHGEVTSLGSYAAANVSFDWRPLGEADWRRTGTTSLGSADPFEMPLLDLIPGGSYEFRAVVEAGGTMAMGRILKFSTSIPTVPDPLAFLLLSATVTIATIGVVLVALVELDVPSKIKKRGGRRRDGQA
ncbi:MAG TPA: hypothetical protein VF992_10715 [Thermoplasmata archaeon]